MRASDDYKSTILQRGLTLILAPLILGLTTLAVLEHVWNQTMRISDAEIRHIKIIGHINRAMQRWGTLSDAYSRSFFSEHPHDAEILAHARRQTLSELERAERLCSQSGDGGEDLAVIHKLQQLFDADDKASHSSASSRQLVMRVLSDASNDGDDHEQKLQQLVADSMQNYSTIKKGERDSLVGRLNSLKQSRLELDRTLSKFVLIVVLTAGVNVLVSCALAWFVSRPIAQRMKVLRLSAEEFQRGNFEVEQLRSRDEFAYLQSVLRNSFESVFSAAKYRQIILSMVAHDMRAPLMSAVASLNLMEEHAEGFADAAIDKLMSIYDQLGEVLKSADSMLASPRAAAAPFSLSYGIGDFNSKGRSADDTSTESYTYGNNFIHSILHPRLFQQILALIILPLVVQTVSLTGIGMQAVQMHRLTERVRHFSDMLMTVNIMLLDTLIAASEKAVNFVTDDFNSQDLAVHFFGEADSDSARLLSMVGDDRLAKQYATLFIAEVKHVRSRMLEGPRPQGFNDTAKALFKVGQIHDNSQLGITSRRLETVWVNNNFKELDEAFFRVKELGDSVKQSFTFSYVLYILAEIIVLVVFVLSVDRRVRALLSRASRVGQIDQEIQPAENKNVDEIGALNSVLDVADSKLFEANKQRKKMTNALSRNLNEPLRRAAADEDSFAELAEEGLSPKSRDYLNSSKKSVMQVMNVLMDLITVEDLTAGEVKLESTTFGIEEFIDEALASTTGLAREKDIEVTSKVEPGLVTADRRQLLRVVINIISNAIKFSGSGTKVEVVGEFADGMARISVKDNGPGLDEADQKRVFDLGYRAKSKQREHGHGLGLSIAKLLVEAHSGTIAVSSKENEGCKFTIGIPA